MSRSATETARQIIVLRERTRAAALSPMAQRLAEQLFEHPVVSVRNAEALMECAFVTANKAVAELEETGLLVEFTGNKRNRRYRFEPYIRLFDRPALEPEGEVPRERTQVP